MKYLVILVGAYLALSGTHGSFSLKVDQSEWEAYKLEHGKHYADPQVDLMRSMIYAKNKHEIEQFNRDSKESRYYTRGLNHLSDWTEEEINSMMGLKVPTDVESHEQLLQNSPDAERFLREILQDSSKDVPAEVDWRKVPGRVSRVKNQGMCGSCWAFSVVGALEGQEVVRVNSSLKQAIDLSVQNIIDCDPKYAGCGGGWMSEGFDMVKNEGGIDDNESYPYYAHFRKCSFSKKNVVITDAGHAILPSGDEKNLQQVVAKFGPVSVGVHATSFESYKGGVFFSDYCKNNTIHDLNHGVLVVGYGTDPKQGDYWIIKNSWSEKWGEQGYLRLARNKGNHCGVATVATIPTF